MFAERDSPIHQGFYLLLFEAVRFGIYWAFLVEFIAQLRLILEACVSVDEEKDLFLD